jgi:hypothetical protein
LVERALQPGWARERIRVIDEGLGRPGGSAWFLKAGEYVQGGAAKVGFVATNSITQGEQVAQLWPMLFHRFGLEITFAHRTFAWGSDARGRAHVHVGVLPARLRKFTPRTVDLGRFRPVSGCLGPRAADMAHSYGVQCGMDAIITAPLPCCAP